MEPAQAPLRLKVNYTIMTSVVDVKEHKERRHVEGSGDKAKFSEESTGWFVTFDGSYEALYFGSEKPGFDKGDKVKITFERMT